ncbi:MAG: polysaccharide biosynthesis/export family protein [Phycisphaerae bacterium]
MAGSGCNSIQNSWLDPTTLGAFGENRISEIRTSLTIEDTPPGIPGATLPTREDQELLIYDYPISAGDVLAIEIYQLRQRGFPEQIQVRVDELGDINLPVVGRVRAAGMTARELEHELMDVLRDRDILMDPQLLVNPQLLGKATWSVFGIGASLSTNAPLRAGTFPLRRPELRVLEAINSVGGLNEFVTDVFVFRYDDPELASHVQRPQRRNRPQAAPEDVDIEKHTPAPPAPPDGDTPRAEADGTPAAREETPATAEATHAAGNAAPGRATAEARGKHAAKPHPATEDELRDAVLHPRESAGIEPRPPVARPDPRAMDAAAAGRVAAQGGAPAADEDLLGVPRPGRFIYKNGEFVPNPDVAEPAGAAGVAGAGAPGFEPMTPAVNWARIAGETSYRVIRIPADMLRAGDPFYNIYVRPGDVLRIHTGEIGLYYVMGQVNRAGPFAFNSEQITLKAAIAAAGSLAGLAWPDRCTVYRRIGQREQMIQVNLDRIFAGKDPDFLIRRGDIINVGTHPFAPFLARVRALTLPNPAATVGYSFVYARNFADIDSFGAKINPANQPRQFPLLFP